MKVSGKITKACVADRFYAPGNRELELGVAVDLFKKGKFKFDDPELNEKYSAPETVDEADAEYEETSTPLPDDFPGKSQLEEEGISTIEEVKAMKKEDLLKIPGVGEATVTKMAMYLEES